MRAARITVLAPQELWSNYDEFYGHHRRSDRLTLAETVSASGLRPVRLSHFFHACIRPNNYVLGTVLWLNALSRMPLSRVYPFTILTFVIVYLAAAPLLASLVLVLAGLAIIATS